MTEFGFTVPCLVDARGELIAGHGRLLAAKRLGMSEVPVVVLGHLTEQQTRAYRLADNQIALNSDWDTTLLLAELERLREEGIDPRLLGFDDDISGLLASINDPDEVPEPPAVPVSRLGDLWLLGAHVSCPKCGKQSKLENALRK
jgi:ParB-like chromosome segregation protein Spo0J